MEIAVRGLAKKYEYVYDGDVYEQELMKMDKWFIGEEEIDVD